VSYLDVRQRLEEQAEKLNHMLAKEAPLKCLRPLVKERVLLSANGKYQAKILCHAQPRPFRLHIILRKGIGFVFLSLSLAQDQTAKVADNLDPNSNETQDLDDSRDRDRNRIRKKNRNRDRDRDRDRSLNREQNKDQRREGVGEGRRGDKAETWVVLTKKDSFVSFPSDKSTAYLFVGSYIHLTLTATQSADLTLECSFGLGTISFLES
jgi:hypothetical protein